MLWNELYPLGFNQSLSTGNKCVKISEKITANCYKISEKNSKSFTNKQNSSRQKLKMAVTPFPEVTLAMGNCVWGDKGRAALPLTSLVAAAPSVLAADMLWLLVRGQGLEPLEGLHLRLGGGWQGSQLKWLRLCDSLCQLAAAGSCSSCRDCGLLTPSSTLLQLQTDVVKFILKQFLIMTCTVPFCSSSCYCCEHRKPTWNNPLWRSERNREKKPQSRASALSKSCEGRDKGLPECLDLKELDTHLLPSLWFWFWPHRWVLKWLSILSTDGYEIQ